jgi:hypothetical protein
MKFNSSQNDFSSGELSRYLRGRTNVEEFFKGAAEMTNFLPMKQGGASLRPGFAIPDTSGFGTSLSNPMVIVDFTPRDNENYIIALYPTNVAADQIKIGRPPYMSAATITKSDYIWNTRTDFTSSSTAFDNTNGNRTDIMDGLQILTQGDLLIVLDGTGTLAPIAIFRTAADTFVVDSYLSPAKLNSSTGVPYLKFPHSNYTFMRHAFTDTNIDTNLRLKPSATTGNITITAENASAAAKSYFTDDVVGMMVKITHSTTTGVAQITSKVSDSVVNATVVITMGGTTASSNWEVSAWNPRDGYPKAGAFFEGRLVLGGNTKYPDTVWLSKTGNIGHFMMKKLAQDASTDASGGGYFGAVNATDAYFFIPASQQTNAIQWMYSSDTLLIGTTSTEFSISGGSDSALSLTTTFVRALSSHGSSNVQPVKVGSSILFVSPDGKRIYEIPRKLSDYTSALEMTSMAEGIIDKAIDLVVDPADTDATPVFKKMNRIYKMVWQEGENVLWCLVKNKEHEYDGLISLTYDKTAKVSGWAKHYIAGGKSISSICCVANPGAYSTGRTLRLYAFHKRRDAFYYSLEFMQTRNEQDVMWMGIPSTSAESVSFMDGAYTYIGPGIANVGSNTEITLLGKQTDVFAPTQQFAVMSYDYDFGGATGSKEALEYHGLFTPVAGVITIPNHSSTGKTYIIGALYDNKIETLPIEAGAQFGVAQGSPRRGHEIVVAVDRSFGGEYSQKKRNEFFPLITVSSNDDEDVGVDNLYTGEVELSLNASPDDPQTVIKQTGPYPLTVLWMVTKGYTYDA